MQGCSSESWSCFAYSDEAVAVPRKKVSKLSVTLSVVAVVAGVVPRAWWIVGNTVALGKHHSSLFTWHFETVSKLALNSLFSPDRACTCVLLALASLELRSQACILGLPNVIEDLNY